MFPCKLVAAVLSAAVFILCGCSSASSVSSVSSDKVVVSEPENVQAVSYAEPSEHIYTAQDLIFLQSYLLDVSVSENLNGRPYDLNEDGKWNISDLCLMKHRILHDVTDTGDTNDTIVVYFSRTNNTEKIANYIIDYTNADSYEIEAAIPYTDKDIEYTNSSCRANQEQNDKSVRPEIAKPIESLEQYEVIYLGYPIWWGEEPRIIDTFLESYDFSDKTVIPFCTSASSGISASEKNIANLAEIGNQLEGRRFSASAAQKEAEEWIDGLNIMKNETEEKLYLTVNGQKISATFEENSSVDALKEKLSEEDVVINAKEYGGFEKVGSLGFSLPTNDKQYVTDFGDIMLYQGNQITLFYNSNSWSYTKIGHVDNMTQDELKALLGEGDVTITLSLK